MAVVRGAGFLWTHLYGRRLCVETGNVERVGVDGEEPLEERRRGMKSRTLAGHGLWGWCNFGNNRFADEREMER